jgi:hypothetical protein
MKKINIVEVNDNTILKINVFSYDNENTVKKRISSKLNTIPEYIVFLSEDILNYDETESFYVYDVFNFIKKTSIESNSNIFSEIYENDDKEIRMELLNMFNIKDIFIIFLVYNHVLDEQYKQTGYFSDIGTTLKDFEQTVLKDFKDNPLNKNIEFDYDVLNKNWENREVVKYNYENKIKENEKSIINSDKLKANFDKIKPLIYEEFNIEKERISVKIHNMPSSVLEIFNDIQLNQDIPFASCKEFYKILKGFKPNFQSLIVSDNLNMELNLKNNFIQITINSNGELYFDHPKLLIKYEDIIDKIKSINLNLDLSEPKTIGLNGSFMFNDIKEQLKVPFNKYVLSDLIMNDKLFSKYMTLSELEKAQKMRFHLYFHDEKNKISFEISSSENNLRISVSKCKDIQDVENFQKNLATLLAIYSERYKNIVEFYKPYVDLNEENIKEEEIITEKLKYIAPEIFLSTSGCGSYNPILLKTDEEYENAIKEGKQVMLFPKNISAKEYKKMVNEGKKPLKFLVKNKYKFVCEYAEHKYPGLIVNKTKNKKEVPLLPCCYKTDQKNKKSKLEFLKYFDIVDKDNFDNFEKENNDEIADDNDEEKENEEENNDEIAEEENENEVKKQQTKIITNKILKEGQFGDLPKEISEFFSKMDTNYDKYYIRKGVKKSKNSFIQCVLECIEEEDLKNINLLEDEDEKKQKLDDYLRVTEYQDIRYELLQFIPVCKQECFKETIEQIEEIVKNNDEYFDPKKFIRLLEYRFNVNIFIFHKDINKETLILPNHINQYYNFSNNKKCIFIYEHYGTLRNYSSYPQCEIILRSDKNDNKNNQYIFDISSEIVKNTMEIYKNLDNVIYYEDKERIFRVNINGDLYLKNNKIVSQVIDVFGKTRIIIIEVDHKKYAINIIPIPPLNVPIISIEESREYNLSGNYDRRIGIMNYENFENIIKGTMGEFSVYLEYKEENNKIKEYNKMKKLSRCIINHFIWFYSNYVNDTVDPDYRSYNDLTNDDFSEFIDMCIEIDPSFNYETIQNVLSFENDGIIREGKLIIKSEETLKRLKYVLKHKIVREYNNVINYYNNTSMSDYYMDIDDFDSYPSFQTLLKGKDFTEKWLQDVNNLDEYELYDAINIKKKQYFFTNQLIDNNTYIARNVDTIEKAIQLGIFWNIEKYNPEKIQSIDDNYGYKIILYSYKNSKDIQKYTIEKENENYAGKLNIIGYKINDVKKFTVLLEL